MSKVYCGSPPGPEPTAVTRTISPTLGSDTSTVIRKVGVGSGVSVDGNVGVGVGVGVSVGAKMGVAVAVAGSGIAVISVGGGTGGAVGSPTTVGASVGATVGVSTTVQATNIKATAANRKMIPRLPNPVTCYISPIARATVGLNPGPHG